MGLVVGTLSIPFIRGEAVHGWGAGLSQARKTIKSCRYPRLAWPLDGLCEPGAPRCLPGSARVAPRQSMELRHLVAHKGSLVLCLSF